MLTLGYFILLEQSKSLKKEKEKLVLSSVKTLAEGSIDALISDDFESLERWLNAVVIKDIYAYGYLSDPKGKILLHTDSKMIASTIDTIEPFDRWTSRTLVYNNQEVKEFIYTSSIDKDIFANAHIGYYTSIDLYAVFEEEGIYFILFVMFFFLALILFATLFIIRLYTHAITKLSNAVESFSFDDKTFDLSKDLSGRPDEIGILAKTFEVMTKRLSDAYLRLKEEEEYLQVKVEERTEDLLKQNEILKKMQNQLVESEKMSALGGLVAGVAHEVNTPLGISITAASIFEQEISVLKKQFDANELTHNNLDNFIKTTKDADDILMRNLKRAATLISNFKKISVDQSSEEIRDFEFNTYLDEIIFTFSNELKKKSVSIKKEYSKEEIQMHSYPGAISQVIVNLLQNALLHAFSEDEKGLISLSTCKKNEHVIIKFCDDGKGVEKDIAKKIFEPFFTTKRNQGGTGLGLNISYNLITQKLGGSIKLESALEKGSCFIIEIPIYLNV